MDSPLPSGILLDPRLLEGKVAVVTGAGRGIGKVVAETLARHGATLCIVSRNSENCTEVSKNLNQEGLKASPFPCDVSNSAHVEQTVGSILQKHESIHILVNNAGITRDGLLVRMKDEEWEEVLRTNLTGCFYFSRAVAKGMMKQREGQIINIASVVGIIGNAGQANYAASKAGMIGLTKSMAKELASRKITVNAVAPGFIQTEMTEKLSDKIKSQLLERIPLNTLGLPSDVANAVLFLASPLARYVTGQVFNVDGGMVM